MTEDAPPPTNSADRLLRVIDLFSLEHPEWTADRIGESLGVSRATQYRYIKSLIHAGLLAPAGGSAYRLGPRFVVLDRQIRLSDPLMRYGPSAMAKACKSLGEAQLLCTYFGDEVLCIHQESMNPKIHSSMERGRPFPLFRGSPSKSILAWLPDVHLRNLMLSHGHEIREAGLGSNWQEFRQMLKTIRNQGYYWGRGEIDADLMGIGVPILLHGEELLGSLTTILPLAKLSSTKLQAIVDQTQRAAADIVRGIVEEASK